MSNQREVYQDLIIEHYKRPRNFGKLKGAVLMVGPIYQFLADHHRRLDSLLKRAVAVPENIDMAAYAEFRKGLLKHIGMEEKILLRETQRLHGEPLPIASKIRLDHGALAALLVPAPTSAIIATIRAILDGHNKLEEGPGGLYEVCEWLAGAEAEDILARLRSAPEVAVRPHLDGPEIVAATRRALARVGYDLRE